MNGSPIMRSKFQPVDNSSVGEWGGEGGGGRVNVVNVQQKSTKELADIRFMS